MKNKTSRKRQKEKIHPLEESLGFKSLLQLGEPTYIIASIAARAGKSEAYVQGRIKLADLIPPVAEAFLQDKITIGHALLIAKLPDSQQQEAFNAAFRGMWTSAGNQQVLIPVRELAAWIESNILLQLARAVRQAGRGPRSRRRFVRELPEAHRIQQAALCRRAQRLLHRPAMFSVKDRRACVEDARNQTPTGADFLRLEHPRGRSLGKEPLPRA